MDQPVSNPKMEPSLRAALNATPEELAASTDLSTGTNAADGLWEVIVLYSGTADALKLAFPKYVIMQSSASPKPPFHRLPLLPLSSTSSVQGDCFSKF